MTQQHHPITPPPELSPASLDVWSRYCSIVEEYGPPRLALADALRAAALYCKRDRMQLLTIAEELEAQ